MRRRVSPLAVVVVAGASVVGCGRTDLDESVRDSDGMAPAASAADANPAPSGPCAGAPCLAALFQTCPPEGVCIVQAGSAGYTSYATRCYANGVTFTYTGSYSGSPDILVGV